MSGTFTVGETLSEYQVRARNGAEHSENKIHDDTVARQYGFEGGLVPGVTIHAYMTRPVVDAFGRDWVERGTISTRFIKPFYEGRMVTIRATVTSADDTGVSLDLQAVNESGEVCAIGTAALPARAAAAPELREFPEAPLPERRPFATESVLGGMDIMGSLKRPWEAVAGDTAYLDEIDDDHPLWRFSDAILHPGYLIRFANSILVQNVELGPWIHVSSDVTHFAAAPIGVGISTRGRVLETFERKGHHFVVMDVLMATDVGQPISRTRHTAIYHVRKVNEA